MQTHWDKQLLYQGEIMSQRAIHNEQTFYQKWRPQCVVISPTRLFSVFGAVLEERMRIWADVLCGALSSIPAESSRIMWCENEKEHSCSYLFTVLYSTLCSLCWIMKGSYYGKPKGDLKWGISYHTMESQGGVKRGLTSYILQHIKQVIQDILVHPYITSCLCLSTVGTWSQHTPKLGVGVPFLRRRRWFMGISVACAVYQRVILKVQIFSSRLIGTLKFTSHKKNTGIIFHTLLQYTPHALHHIQ